MDHQFFRGLSEKLPIDAFRVGAKELFAFFDFRNSSKEEDREKQLRPELTRVIIFIGPLENTVWT